jgi:hypothetical protein
MKNDLRMGENFKFKAEKLVIERKYDELFKNYRSVIEDNHNLR